MKKNLMVLVNWHVWCPETLLCERCGISMEQHRAVSIDCYYGENVVSLYWWAKLKAHRTLSDQLVQSLERELNT